MLINCTNLISFTFCLLSIVLLLLAQINEEKCPVDPDWIKSMHSFSKSKGPRSQGAQDYYFDKIFSIIKTTNKFFVEFGFNEPSYTSGGSGANTWNLHDNGWRGLLLDATHNNPSINLHAHFLYSYNIAQILNSHTTPKNMDLLSCDMDSHDLWVLKAILEGGYKPRVISTEYNSNYNIEDTITLADTTLLSRSLNHSFEFQGCAWGASAGAIRTLLEPHGYALVGRVGYLDLIWIHKTSIRPCYIVPPFKFFFADSAVGSMLHHFQAKSVDVLTKLIDFKVYMATNDLVGSNKAAIEVLKQRNYTCFQTVFN